MSSLAGHDADLPVSARRPPRVAARRGRVFDARRQGPHDAARRLRAVLRRAAHGALRHDQRVRARRRDAPAASIRFRSASPGWQAPGHVLPEGAMPLPRVTITVAPDARTPSVHQVSGGVTRSSDDDDAVRRRRLRARTAPAGRARIQPASSRRSGRVGGRTTSTASPARPPTSRSSPTSARRGIAVCCCRRRGVSATRASCACPTPGRRPRTTSRASPGRWTTTARAAIRPIPPACRLASIQRREKGPADTDQPHRLVVSGVVVGAVALHAVRHRHGGLRHSVHAARRRGPQRRRAADRRSRAHHAGRLPRRRSAGTPSGCRHRSPWTCGWRVRSDSRTACHGHADARSVQPVQPNELQRGEQRLRHGRLSRPTRSVTPTAA